jgi:hypothetical protein
MRKLSDIFIIVALFFWAFFLYSYFIDSSHESWWTFQKLEKSKSTYEELRNQQILESKKDAEIYNTAQSLWDIKLCDAIKNSEEQARCRDIIIASEALKSKNTSQCDELSSLPIIERCKDNISFAEAEYMKNSALCISIQDATLRSQCSDSIDNINLSERIASGSLDKVFCETLGGEVKNKCFLRIQRKNDSLLYETALTSRLLSDCDSIDDKKLRLQCRDALIFEKAIRDENMDLCATISDEEKSQYCQKSLLARSEKSLYLEIVSTGDITSCDRLQTKSLKEQCHDVILISLVRTNQNKQLCQRLYNTGMLSSCESLIIPGK